MADKEGEEFKAQIRSTVSEIIKESRLSPVSAPITEIIIRVGSSEGVRIVGGGGTLGCPTVKCCPQGSVKITTENIQAVNKDAFVAIKKKAERDGHTTEQVVEELFAKYETMRFADFVVDFLGMEEDEAKA